MRKSGQIATEYMMIIGIILIITIPLIYYSMRESNINIQSNQLEDTINTLTRAADSVYAVGPGTKKYVWVNMPGGVEAYSFENKTILLKIYMFGGLSDAFGETKADLAGSLPLTKGTHRIIVEMLDSGYVQFGIANDTAAPNVIWSYPQGTINFYGIVLRVTTNEPSICKYDEDDVDYSSMSENFYGSALTHERDIGILSNGDYVYYVRCQDPSGNIMQESSIINFTIVPPTVGEGNDSLPATNETSEPDPPIVNLMYPDNGYIDNDGLMIFGYNVSDESSVWFCMLVINSMEYQTELWITKDIPQNFTISGIEFGNNLWNVSCSDVHGNINTSITRNFTMNYTQDHDLPVVQLVAPPDYTIRNYWLTKFSYNVSDVSSGINYCNLNLNGVIEGNSTVDWSIRDSPVVEHTTQDITLPLFKGNYTWNISCADDSYLANVGYSESRHLEINVTAGEEAFLDSCAGWCGYNGYIDGICRQNEAKCNEYIGGTWESEGNTYCTVETADFCCCTQEVIS